MWTELDALPGEYGGPRYPKDFLSDYEPLECLKHGALGDTLLVRSIHGARFVARCCYKGSISLLRDCEREILPKLRHERIPAFVTAYDGDDMFVVVREFVPGVSLAEYSRKHACTPEFVQSIGIQLCDILHYLHRQNPPIIHRDIKPQNIILDEDGHAHLIDFGISRIHRDGASSDTVCFGTTSFAPPEQYGFAQTDCRADIFSLGVLMGWLLTGETLVRNMIPRISYRRLARIIQKCTDFAPENRYANVLQLRAALQGTRLRYLLPRARLAVPIMLLTMGLALTIPILGPNAASSVKFREPLIEQSVRLVLHKAPGDRISEDDLTKVTGIYAFGQQAFDNFSAFSGMSIADGTLKRGNISSLEDVAMLPNLETLTIGFQNITDISPLRRLTHLQYIDLKHNPIVDLTPLAGKTSCHTVFLFDTDVTDLTPLSTCPNLTHLDVGLSGIQSVNQLKAVPSVECVAICLSQLDSLTGIEKLGHLRELCINNTNVRDLSPLKELEGFERVEIDWKTYDEIKLMPGEYSFEVVWV